MATAQSAPNKGNLVVDVRHEMQADLMAYKDEVSSYLGKQMDPERYLLLAVKTLLKNPDVLACDKLSIQVAVLDAAGLQLEIDGPLGHAYIVPYKGKAQFQIGYKGYNELMVRTGKLRPRHCGIVYEGDKWEYDDGAVRVCKHLPCPPSQRKLDEKGQPIEVAAYSVIEFTDGKGRTLETDFEWMWAEDIEAIRKRSPAGKGGPWVTDRGEMVKKTVRRRHAKRMPLGSEASRALAYEEQFDAGLEPGSYRQEVREVESETVDTTPKQPEGDPELRKVMADKSAKDRKEPAKQEQTGYAQASPVDDQKGPQSEDQQGDHERKEPRVVYGVPIKIVQDHFVVWKDVEIPTKPDHPFHKKTWKMIETLGRQGDEATLKLLNGAIAQGIALLKQKKAPGEMFERAALVLEQIEINSSKKPAQEGDDSPFS